MARWKNKRWEEKDPRYLFFAIADTLKQFAVYVAEAHNEYLALRCVNQIVGLLHEIARETVEANYDERVWVPVYNLLMEFLNKDPYDDLFSLDDLKGLEELRDKLAVMLEQVKATAEKVKREMEELRRKEEEYSKRRDDLPF